MNTLENLRIQLELLHKQAVNHFQLEAYRIKKTTHEAHLLLHDLGFGLYAGQDQLLIPDLTLAESLGFSQPRDMRKLISRHHGALMDRGSMLTYFENTGRKGRQSSGHLLTLEQAFYLIAKSETEIANSLLFLMVDITSAFMRGDLLPSDFNAAVRIQARLQQEQIRIESHREEKEARRDALKWLNQGKRRTTKSRRKAA